MSLIDTARAIRRYDRENRAAARAVLERNIKQDKARIEALGPCPVPSSVLSVAVARDNMRLILTAMRDLKAMNPTEYLRGLLECWALVAGYELTLSERGQYAYRAEVKEKSAELVARYDGKIPPPMLTMLSQLSAPRSCRSAEADADEVEAQFDLISDAVAGYRSRWLGNRFIEALAVVSHCAMKFGGDSLQGLQWLVMMEARELVRDSVAVGEADGIDFEALACRSIWTVSPAAAAVTGFEDGYQFDLTALEWALMAYEFDVKNKLNLL